MSVAISLSSTLSERLKNRATRLGISLNELAEKLIYQGLSKRTEQEPSQPSGAVGSRIITNSADNNGRLTMAEIVARAKARPRNSASIHPPTGTLDEVLATFKAKPSSVPQLTAEEWEKHWWSIRQKMRERD